MLSSYPTLTNLLNILSHLITVGVLTDWSWILVGPSLNGFVSSRECLLATTNRLPTSLYSINVTPEGMPEANRVGVQMLMLIGLMCAKAVYFFRGAGGSVKRNNLWL